ncbi:MAG: hypothetical protein ACYC0B_02170 [Gemmatimonadaceae bacterium]
MNVDRDIRITVYVIAGALLALAAARCNGRLAGEEDAAAATARARIEVLRAGVVRRQARIDELEAAARATDAPHEAAVASTRGAERDAERRIRAARAALAADSIDVVRAAAELDSLATATELLLVRGRLERAAAASRIGAYSAVVAYVQQSAPAVDSLVHAQAERIRQLERGRPWWRRALGGLCTAGATSAGAGGGAAIGGPAGAAVGAVGGLVVGALSCR